MSFPGTPPTTVTSFLREHDRCGAGFSVDRPGGGSGPLTITCRGCGATLSHVPELSRLEPTDRRELDELERALTSPLGRLPHDGPTAGRAAPTRPPERPREERPRRAGSWVLTLLVAAVLALTTIALVLALSDDSDVSGPGETREAAAGSSRPQAGGAAGSGRGGARGTGAPAARRSNGFRQLKVGSLYSIGLPRGWQRSTSADAVSFSPPGQSVEVRVFSQERPDLDVDEMLSVVSASVLADHPEATLGAAGARSIRGAVTRALIVRYPWGREHALVVAAGPYRHLVVSRISEDAPPRRVREAARVRASFDPL